MSPFDGLTSAERVRTDIAAAFTREWGALQQPGSHYTSQEKIAICQRARTVRRGGTSQNGLPELTNHVVDTIAMEPASIREAWVDGIVARGLPMTGYVETLSLVSRIAAVDAFHDALGVARPALPTPGAGAPTGEFNPMALPSKGFVPMTRGTSIWWSLTLVPEAYARMEDLHCVLYLSPEEMQAPGSPRQLTRPQMELIASRTSLVNECFY